MLFGTALSSWYLAHFFKNLIALPRPDLTKALFQPLEAASYGLPSGHAALMFALAFTMHSFDKKAGYALFVIAIFAGVARALAGVHYWYDILGGAVLGMTVSAIVVYACKRLIRHA
jgi:undecaprenyl-diphosphatase